MVALHWISQCGWETNVIFWVILLLNNLIWFSAQKGSQYANILVNQKIYNGVEQNKKTARTCSDHKIQNIKLLPNICEDLENTVYCQIMLQKGKIA